ncbi:MAG TPA: RnfABCDGE type electron transport complex subunit B [Steroidobacter sp.]|jgi:electron transport complex protein RnfB|nr:RnfABCDGE type electron transport complex subunit B [Steroidobacter sp.]
MMLLLAIAIVAALAATAGAAAALAARAPRLDERLIEQVNALLPQTQCGRCTFVGCRPYAAAIVRAHADINQCPPGGDQTAASLAAFMGRKAKPVDAGFGLMPPAPMVAWIDEVACIGCTKCIQACPVDAIVGASRYTHTVIAAHCTGCELCIPPCPVDCIEMRPARPIAKSQPSNAEQAQTQAAGDRNRGRVCELSA